VTALLAVTMVAAACSGGSSDPEEAAPNPTGPVITDTVDCDEIDRTFVGRERPVPGQHVQLDVFPIGDGGAYVDASACVSVRDDADGSRVESSVISVPTDERIVAIAIDPGRTDADLAEATALAEEIVAALPDAEIALYGLGAVDDPDAAGVALIDGELDWVIAESPEQIDDGWRTSSFLLSGSFLRNDSDDVGWPEPSDATDPAFGRAVFSVFDEPGIGAAELTIEHTHGAVVWINDMVVLRSNMSESGNVPADPTSGLRTTTVTVPAGTLRSGTNVVSVDVHRSPNGDPVNVAAGLVASDAKQQPAAALAPSSRNPDLGGIAALRPTSGPPGRLADALDLIVADIEATHDDESEALRSVVVVSPEGVPEVDLNGRADAVVAWVGAGDEVRDGIDLAVDADGADPAGELAARLDHIAASRIVVGVCGSGPSFEAEVEVGTVNLTTTLREAPPEDSAGECDAAAAARYEPELTETVSLTFTEDQREVWEQSVATNDRTPFRASVELGDDWGEAPAEVRLRGQSTIDCDRKSYSLNLDTGHRRPLTDRVASDEFMLLSLCLDRGFVRTASMLDLLDQMDLFPVGSRLVRLELDGEPAGIYLLVERPDEALRDAQPQLDGIVRRALDTSFQQSSTSWSDTGRDDVVFDAYENTILVAEQGGEDVLDRLSEVMDVDAYLRWLAVMSATGNGDYVDEVFFAGVGVGTDGSVEPYWYPVAWDPDDLFSPCHFEDFQFQDPLGLASCAEARIDHALLGNEVGYAAYVEALDSVLDGLPPAQFAQALAATRARLVVLVDDDFAAAMPELAFVTGLDTSSADGFMDAVDREIEDLNAQFSERHRNLADGIEAWASGAGAVDAPIVEVEFGATVEGAAVPIRVSAVAPDGSPDRSRSGPISVSLGGVDVEVPMRRGVGIATLEPTEEGSFEVAVDGTAHGTMTVAGEGEQVGSDPVTGRVSWGPGIVEVEADLVVEPGGVLVIEPGTTVLMGRGINLDVLGRLDVRGTSAAPVLFTERGRPWGGISVTGELAMSHTFLTGGGSDQSRFYGHSESQPVVFGGTGSAITLDGVVIADSAGKATGVEGGDIDILNSVFTRTDTGGEFHDSKFTVNGSWFLDFPAIGRSGDDDNDALYLGATRSASSVSDSVFLNGADDGIDHAGAEVSIERVWVGGFAHECIATSTGGNVLISDSVLDNCEQGLQIGYGSPQVSGDHLLIQGNDVGVRYGDEYFIEATGALKLTSSLLLGNVLAIAPSTPAVAVSGTVTDEAESAVVGVTVDSPQLDADLVWRAGGPRAAGLISGWP
jgi:hypothetical protein